MQAGDTLTRIARRLQVSLARLVALNRLRNPDRIYPGEKLRVDELDRQARTERPRPPLGSLSRRYEVGNLGPGAVSSGHGDHGGVSYGSYQLSSGQGRVDEFLAAEGQPWAMRFHGLDAGSPAFSQAWRACAAADPDEFEAAQHRYIERTHYAVQAELVKRESRLDLDSRSAALRDVVWSVAVQHGPASHVVLTALGTLAIGPDSPGFDAALIAAIYAERNRCRADGTLAYFGSSNAAVQDGVARRFSSECREALAMLRKECAT
jgi:hypothetical protein